MTYGGFPLSSVPFGGSRQLPPNITATSMILDKNTCISPCSIIVTITWTNIGGITASFTAGVSVDNEPIMALSPDILNPAETVTHSFTINNLLSGTHTICPVPN